MPDAAPAHEKCARAGSEQDDAVAGSDGPALKTTAAPEVAMGAVGPDDLNPAKGPIFAPVGGVADLWLLTSPGGISSVRGTRLGVLNGQRVPRGH